VTRAPAGIPNDLQDVAVNLYWLPLGAGGHSVRFNGLVYEAAVALLGHRPACDLYHSALEVRVPEGRFVIEQTPVPDNDGAKRGVVAGGAVGTRWAGRQMSRRCVATPSSRARGSAYQRSHGWDHVAVRLMKKPCPRWFVQRIPL
jgi:hypothetical protein